MKKNEKLLRKYADFPNRVEWCLENDEDLKKLNFRGVYVILEKDKVIYIGSALPVTRTIKVRLKEHLGGNKTHSSIVEYLKSSRNINDEEAKKLLKTFNFIAFEYISLEYQLISETDGIINKSGKKNSINIL